LKLPEDHCIFITDNCSTDETKNLKEIPGRLYVERLNENKGFGFASNRSFARAASMGYENATFINNDIKVDSAFDTWTQPLIASAAKGNIVGPTVGCLDDNLNFICEAKKPCTKGYWYVSGWNVTASMETWKKLIPNGCEGPFDNVSFFCYFEDTDLSFRAKVLGVPFEIVQVPARHFGKATTKKIGLSKMYPISKSKFVELWGNKTDDLAKIKGAK
jgi:GT2 family glycosyltransferase